MTKPQAKWDHISNKELLKLYTASFCDASRKALNLPTRKEAREEILQRMDRVGKVADAKP